MTQRVGLVGMGLMGQAFIKNMRERQFIVQGFDVETLTLTTPPVLAVENVFDAVGSGTAYLSVSDNGTLLYVPGDGAAANDPHLLARRMIVRDAPGGPQVGIAPRLSETPGSIRRAPFTRGQHTDEILADFLGYSEGEIEALRAGGGVE